MGFNALFEREDVLTILKDTLEDYYNQVCKTDVKFEYSDKYSKNSFILIPKLGMIMRSFPCEEIRAHYYKAYNIRGNIIKNVGAKILIYTATHSRKSFSMKKYLNVIQRFACTAVLFRSLETQIKIIKGVKYVTYLAFILLFAIIIAGYFV